MQVKIKSLHMENFKGAKQATYNFESKNVSVMGANATGKTTIADSLWWLLFNKDSQGNEKFSIRPLDKDGKQIDNVEICVSVVLDVDGKEMELKKVQKQNWVKKSGTSETVLQGNVNSYEVDGYPKSEKEYKECVAGIVSEDLFKILTSPTYFPGMKWQEQRKILMQFVTDISDVELAGQGKRFADLIGELEKAPSIDDIKKKYQKALNEWKKKQAELPVRIDEAEKQKVDIDVSELELLKNALNEQIAANKAKREGVSREFEEQQKAGNGVLELQFELNDLQRKANEENNRKRRELEEEISSADMSAQQHSRTIILANDKITIKKRDLADYEKYIAECRDMWNETNALEFDENSLICSMCGQEYPEERKDQIRGDFKQKKADKLADISDKGNGWRQRIKETKAEIEQLEKSVEIAKKQKEMAEKRSEELEEQLDKLPQSIDISDRPEVQEIQRQIAEKEAAMNKGNSAEEIRQQLKDELSDLQSQITEVEKQIALAQKNVEIDDRIAELREEQREVAQKVADQERMLFLIEEFIRYKMDSVSETINSKLDGICVKLFERQINQGIKECCELTYNGVPYQSLNSGHRIVAGLKIIKALQELCNVYPCVFVDNAESVNAFNLPNMDCQMIFLTVTEDKELRVEIKE